MERKKAAFKEVEKVRDLFYSCLKPEGKVYQLLIHMRTVINLDLLFQTVFERASFLRLVYIIQNRSIAFGGGFFGSPSFASC